MKDRLDYLKFDAGEVIFDDTVVDVLFNCPVVAEFSNSYCDECQLKIVRFISMGIHDWIVEREDSLRIHSPFTNYKIIFPSATSNGDFFGASADIPSLFAPIAATSPMTSTPSLLVQPTPQVSTLPPLLPPPKSSASAKVGSVTQSKFLALSN